MRHSQVNLHKTYIGVLNYIHGRRKLNSPLQRSPNNDFQPESTISFSDQQQENTNQTDLNLSSYTTVRVNSPSCTPRRAFRTACGWVPGNQSGDGDLHQQLRPHLPQRGGEGRGGEGKGAAESPPAPETPPEVECEKAGPVDFVTGGWISKFCAVFARKIVRFAAVQCDDRSNAELQNTRCSG